MTRRIMITGGCGFIGSNLIRYWNKKYPDDTIINIDAMTYAARPGFLRGLSWLNNNYIFDVCHTANRDQVAKMLLMYKPDHIINLAAESHVCRSIDGPDKFVNSNIVGTFTLMDEFRKSKNPGRFLHVSTDEVFGDSELLGQFDETSKYKPTSPYAASKAASDLLVNCYAHTFGIDTVITNCSNNFGPNQHEEKLIPKTISSFFKKQPMTLYGDGNQIRDWIYVEDHCRALDLAFHKGVSGESYCISSGFELTNYQIVGLVQGVCEEIAGHELVCKDIHSNDRPTDDRKYSISNKKIRALGWSVSYDSFRQQLTETVKWYNNDEKGN